MEISHCFYCGVTVASGAALGPRNTADHIYPRSMLRKLSPEHRAQLFSHPAFHGLNRVTCCEDCNSYKGRLHPIDWLVIMPNKERASLLGERLIKMGESMEVVFSALRRRAF